MTNDYRESMLVRVDLSTGPDGEVVIPSPDTPLGRLAEDVFAKVLENYPRG